MKKFSFRNFLLSGFIMLMTSNITTAQVQDSVVISAIPKPLSWYNQPQQFTASKSSLTITAGAKTDMFRDPNVTYNTENAPKLLFEADADFVLTAGIQHDFLHKWDGGAIVLIEDSLNWIKFCFEKDYTGARRVVSVVTKDISDDCNSVALTANKVFYKIAKADNVITLYYSTDNKNWFLVRHLQFNNKQPLKLGFMAQSPTGDKCRVKFSQIRYVKQRIGDPYLGE